MMTDGRDLNIPLSQKTGSTAVPVRMGHVKAVVNLNWFVAMEVVAGSGRGLNVPGVMI